jgi:hypothetical protein
VAVVVVTGVAVDVVAGAGPAVAGAGAGEEVAGAGSGAVLAASGAAGGGVAGGGGALVVVGTVAVVVVTVRAGLAALAAVVLCLGAAVSGTTVLDAFFDPMVAFAGAAWCVVFASVTGAAACVAVERALACRVVWLGTIASEAIRVAVEREETVGAACAFRVTVDRVGARWAAGWNAAGACTAIGDVVSGTPRAV